MQSNTKRLKSEEKRANLVAAMAKNRSRRWRDKKIRIKELSEPTDNYTLRFVKKNYERVQQRIVKAREDRNFNNSKGVFRGDKVAVVNHPHEYYAKIDQ